MGLTEFTEENVVQGEGGFPRLKLARDEIARIVCLENPWSEYVHNLQMPKLIKGKPVRIEKKKMDGETYEAYDMDFIGNPICLGDPGILREKGRDHKNCPACAEAENSDRVWSAKRRFAMHVIKYETKSRGFLAEPFSCRVVMWCFTEKMFGDLVTIAANNKGGLKAHDLILGPPEEPISFQKFRVVPSDEAAWLLGGETRQKLVIETFQGSKVDDRADPFCGKKKNREWIENALVQIRARWNIVNGATTSSSIDMGNDSESLAAGLEDLLNSSSKSANSAPVDSSMADLLNASSAPATAPAPSPAPEIPVPEGESKPVDSLESLLADLGN